MRTKVLTHPPQRNPPTRPPCRPRYKTPVPRHTRAKDSATPTPKDSVIPAPCRGYLAERSTNATSHLLPATPTPGFRHTRAKRFRHTRALPRVSRRAQHHRHIPHRHIRPKIPSHPRQKTPSYPRSAAGISLSTAPPSHPTSSPPHPPQDSVTPAPGFRHTRARIPSHPRQRFHHTRAKDSVIPALCRGYLDATGTNAAPHLPRRSRPTTVIPAPKIPSYPRFAAGISTPPAPPPRPTSPIVRAPFPRHTRAPFPRHSRPRAGICPAQPPMPVSPSRPGGGGDDPCRVLGEIPATKRGYDGGGRRGYLDEYSTQRRTPGSVAPNLIWGPSGGRRRRGVLSRPANVRWRVVRAPGTANSVGYGPKSSLGRRRGRRAPSFPSYPRLPRSLPLARTGVSRRHRHPTPRPKIPSPQT